jgi:hypothetical protein
MADMWAIVDEAGEIECVYISEEKALMRLHSIHDCGITGEQSITFEDRGYRCIPVTVTPKSGVDCQLCERFIRYDEGSTRCLLSRGKVCINGSEYVQSQPVQLYNL